MVNRNILLSVTVIAIFTLSAGVVWADEVTSAINYQGRLADSSGSPLSGTYMMTFRLYEAATGGTALDTEIHDVVATDGLFNKEINFDQSYFDGRALWLGVKVGTDSEMTPRQELRPVPYALSLVPGARIMGAAQWNLNVETTHPSGGALRGQASATSGTNYGVVGASKSPDGYGGYFYNDGGGVGVYGKGGEYGGYFDGNVYVSDNVGIGTVSPNSELHVNDASAGAQINVDGNGGTYGLYLGADLNHPWMGSRTNHDLRLVTNATEKVRIKNNGDVGIGTPSPGAKLDVAAVSTTDSVKIGATTAWAGATHAGIWDDHGHLMIDSILHLPYQTSYSGIRMASDASASDYRDIIVAGGASSYMDFRKDGSTQVRIDTSGNVGIGTSKPNDKLEVAGGAIRFGSGSYKTGGVETGRIFVDTGGTVSDFSNDAWIFEKSDGNTENPDSPIAFVTVGGDDVVRPRLVIQGKGNVGIGTTKPDARLHVNDGDILLSNNQAVRFEDKDGLNHRILRLDGNNDVTLWNPKGGANDDIYFGTGPIGGSNIRMVVKGGGNVEVKRSLSVSGTKNFLIDHPLDPEHKELIHSTLEGPEAGVFYRGEAQLSNGEATVMLPDYFEALTRKEDRTVLLTPKFEGDEQVSMLAASGVKDGKFRVRMIDSKNPSQKFYWEVKAVRADVEILEVERTKTLSQ